MDNQMDFSALATKYGVKCTDGLTIAKGSFAHQDGARVPMVYQHNHKDIDNVIGHCILKEEDEGLRLYGYLNPDVSAGQKAKSLIQHGDITAVSIFASELQKDSTRTVVKHGNIKEVSIVLAGANPGAVIDYIALEHSDGSLEFSEDEGTIYNGENIDKVYHSEDMDSNEKPEEKVEHEDKAEVKAEEKVEDKAEHEDKIVNNKKLDEAKENHTPPQAKDDDKEDKELDDIKDVELTKDQEDILETLIKNIEKDTLSKEEKESLKKKYDSLPKKIQRYMEFVIGSLATIENDSNKKKGEKDMGNISQSVFDKTNENTLSHDDIKAIFDDARKCGSLKESILEHAATYGINGIENLFPDYKSVGDPATIKRDDTFVGIVMDGVKKVPFAKIRSTAFNITAAEARAKGYVRGDRKVEEVITALKRETPPQTVYKKQKLDRDDIADITDFDTVAYLKKEMQDMLKEELARAILIGDGRLPDADDKIKETNIRPIASDDSTYTIKANVTFAANAKNADIADEIIEKLLRARKNYKGSGNPVFFCSPDYLTTMLLAKDTIGRKLYANETDLASALRVSRIVEVPVMEGATYTDATTSKVYDIIGIAVNLKDYTIGANDLGKTAMFDDFDINYNQFIYLIETRCSGALTVPYSAIVLLKEQTNSAG